MRVLLSGRFRASRLGRVMGDRRRGEATRKKLEDMRDVDERGQWEQLAMSSRSGLLKAKGTARTHNVQYVKPNLLLRRSLGFEVTRPTGR